MSVCEHDPNCPGHGPDHDSARKSEHQRAEQDREAYLLRRPMRKSSLGVRTAVNLEKDRSLSGKARRRARKAGR